MKKQILPFFLLTTIIFCFLACRSQKSDSATSIVENEAITSAEESGNSLLWRIEGKGLAAPSYLFGTIHLISAEEFFLTDKMKDAFASAEQIVMELKMDDPNMQQELMQYAQMPEGQSLESLLSPEEYALVNEKTMELLGMGAAPFQRMYPILFSAMFIQQFIEGPPASYEMTLLQMAQEQGKPILGLESIKEQVEALAKIPTQEQAVYLVEMLRDLNGNKNLFEEMVNIYQEQNIEELHRYIIQQTGGLDFSTHLINKRNTSWIPKIEMLIQQKSTFIAVGGGHLGGKNGVVKLLQQAGYTLKPIR